MPGRELIEQMAERSARHRDLGRAESMLRQFMGVMEARGIVRRWTINRRCDQIVMILRADLCSGGDRSYAIRDDELRMGGEQGFRTWLEHVERDLLRERFRSAPDIRNRAADDRYPLPYLSRDSAELQRFVGAMYAIVGMDWAPDPAAEQRSKDLFIKAAGKKAFTTLHGGGNIAITGSLGTTYRLYPVASYCVERVSDRTRYCAVVPGVPLWDHLLGIKLMVEHDEPKFLRTANVSRPTSDPRFTIQEWATIPRDNPGHGYG